MVFHTFFKVSPRTVRKFIVDYLGFNKENGYSNVKVKRADNFSFSVRILLFSSKALNFSRFYYGTYNFVPYKDTFTFENLDEGINFNENGENDKIWQEYIKCRKNTKRKKLIAFWASL